MTLTSDKVAFSQSRSLLVVQCLSNRAATGQRCTVGWKLRAPGIADTTYLLSEKQNQRVKNNYCYVCKSPLRLIDFLISERHHWDSKLRIPTADYQEVLHDDNAALAWLLALRRVGIVYLKGAPTEQGQLARLGERIGYLRLTFYG